MGFSFRASLLQRALNRDTSISLEQSKLSIISLPKLNIYTLRLVQLLGARARLRAGVNGIRFPSFVTVRS